MFSRAASAFDNLLMGCVFDINTVHKTVEKKVSSISLKFTFMYVVKIFICNFDNVLY